jgi:hypothetical protein
MASSKKGGVNQVGWDTLREIVIEDLQNVKKILFRIPERLWIIYYDIIQIKRLDIFRKRSILRFIP